MRLTSDKSYIVCGKSGCGKSTLGSLISRLYDVTKGKIVLNGVSYKNLSKNTIR